MNNIFTPRFVGLIILGSFLLIFGYFIIRSFVQNAHREPVVLGIAQYLSILDKGVDGFKSQMTDLGYKERRDIMYKYGAAEGSIDELDIIIQGYIDDNVDIIYAYTSVAGRRALKLTSESNRTDIPIVYGHADHPVETGLAVSFQSSGNNTTGIAVNLAETTAKRLEFMLRMRPEIKKVGLFVTEHTDPAAQFAMDELRKQAGLFDMSIIEYRVVSPPGAVSVNEMREIADRIKPGDIDAVFNPPGPVLTNSANQDIVIKLSKRLKIPFAAFNIPAVQNGGLFTYGHDHVAVGQQAALMADKILKGAKPGEIPLEFPKKNFLVINMDTAEEIGISVPQSVLEIADIVIGG